MTTEHYEIEEILSQWDDGIIFLATDARGRAVILRRFNLPSPVLNLLSASDRYAHALVLLSELRADHLLPILDGGLDPIDHTPWLVSPWIDHGDITDLSTQDHPLSEQEFQLVKGHALKVIKQLGEHASALSLEPRDILISRHPEGPTNIHFQLDAREWLIAYCAGRPPSPDRDLIAELNKLKQLCVSTSHSPPETLRSLNPPPPSQSPTSPPLTTSSPTTITLPPGTHPSPQLASSYHSSNRASLITIAILSVALLIGLTILFSMRKKQRSLAEATTPASSPAHSQAHSPQAARLSPNPEPQPTSSSQAKPEQEPTPPSPATASPPSADSPSLLATDLSAISQLINQEITLRGRVDHLSYSSSGKTAYLNFDDPNTSVSAEVRLSTADSPSTTELEALVGKTIQVTGTVRQVFQRTVLRFNSLKSIEEITNLN